MATPRIQTAATQRAAAIRRGAQISRSKSASLPAPVGGWNARDSLAEMEEDDAVNLTNWFPSATDVSVRPGYQQWATGFTGQCESLMPYNGPTASKLFAAVATALAFYDVSAQGAVGAAVQSSLTNARWQSINFATSGGNFMYCVNGADSPRLYDGTNWTTITGVSVPAITGVTTSTLVHVNAFKRRLWFVELDTLKVWYLPVDSIGGAAQALDFRSLAGLGGYMMAMGTWTIDAGTGVDDLAVFVTSEGQVIVYRGIDPSNEVTWALAGVWNVGAPIGRRCMQKWGGDLLIFTFDGVFVLSSYLQSDRIDTRVALSDKIRNAFSEAITVYSENFGWDMIVYPKQNMLITNIPVVTGDSQQQYVMNTISKSWCNFTNITANCWMLFEDEPYFGADGFVGLFGGSYADNTVDIQATAAQAFNYFGSRGQLKRWSMMRPMISSDGVPAILAGISVDYETTIPTTPTSFQPTEISSWDVAIWDDSVWGGDIIFQTWQGIKGIGYCAAPILVTSINGMKARWIATDLVMEGGAIL